MLTDQEKIILHYYVLTGREDWQNYFIMSHPDKNLTNLTKSSLRTYVSNWRNNPEVKDYLLSLQIEKRQNEQTNQEVNINGPGSLESENTNKTKENENNVNFLDRDEFLKEINKGANHAKDEKDRREYLKMISDNLRYKDSDKEEYNDIQRFYTPITCQDCPLYKEKQKTLK